MATYTVFTIDQGSDFAATANLQDANGLPLNITNCTVRGQMRKSYFSTGSYNFTCTIVNATSGIISISMAAALTALIKAGLYVFDIEVVGVSTITRVLEGQIEVTPSVYQSPTPSSQPIPIINPDGNTRYKVGKGIQFYNPTTGLWHTKMVIGNPPQDAWDAGEE